MQITWTNCADEMPPDDKTLVIVNIADKQTTINTGHKLHILCQPTSKLFKVTKWCHYTPEKWKGLTK